MKRNLALIAMIFGVILTSAAAVSAQTTRQIRTTVPFDFVVSGTELPAGDYVITFGGSGISRNSVIVRSADGKGAAVAMVRTETVSLPNEVTGVNFQRVNGEYRLEGVTLYALKIHFNSGSDKGPGLTLAMK